MSGNSLQKVINNSLKLVGKNTGFKYAQYRPDTYTNPLETRNYIADVMVAISVDEAFKKSPDELEEFFFYVDPTSVNLGDILYSTDLAKTYVVTDKMELRAPRGVLAQDRFNILRPVLLSGDVKTGFSQIGTAIPAAVKVVGAKDSHVVAKNATLGASSHEIEMWTWITPGFIHLNDVIEINSLRYLVTFAQSNAKGTNLKLKSTKVGV